LSVQRDAKYEKFPAYWRGSKTLKHPS
jgi:hypothetical protein